MPNETTSFTPVGASKDIVTLWRPVGPRELKLIRQADMRAFPPRLPGQPIFYPVLSEDYAVKMLATGTSQPVAAALSLVSRCSAAFWTITVSNKLAARRI
jgi:hypothetical protein